MKEEIKRNKGKKIRRKEIERRLGRKRRYGERGKKEERRK